MKKPRAALIVLGSFIFCGSASAQFSIVSLGVKGGVALNDANSRNDEGKRYVVGPSVEFRLPFHFAAEVDALYMRTGSSFSYIFNNPIDGSVSYTWGRTRGNQWDFPVLGKYYFGERQKKVQPFLGTGYAFRKNWQHNDTNASIVSGTPLTLQNYSASIDSSTRLQIGATFAAGVRVRVGRIAILPELRYTRWGSDDFATRRNEGRFLLGISF
jgi:hypothetical protein